MRLNLILSYEVLPAVLLLIRPDRRQARHKLLADATALNRSGRHDRQKWAPVCRERRRRHSKVKLRATLWSPLIRVDGEKPGKFTWNLTAVQVPPPEHQPNTLSAQSVSPSSLRFHV